MTERNDEIEKRIQALERLARDVKIALGIGVVFLAGFFGFESYYAVPRAIEDALKTEAIALLRKQAEESAAAARKAEGEAIESAREAAEARRRASKLQPSRKELEDMRKRMHLLEDRISGRFLYFRNGCDLPIKVVIRYKMPYGQWRSLGWWNIDPQNGSYLAERDKRIIVNSDELYFYAETTKEPILFWKGEVAGEFDGKTVAMTKVKLETREDEYFVEIDCEH